MQYTVRRVDPTDPKIAATLVGMQAFCLPGDTVYYPDNGWWFLVFDESKAPVGFAGMVPSLQWKDAVYFCRAGVLETHRGHGLQKRLIHARINHARKLGYKWAISNTYENPPSINSMVNCGFRAYTPSKPWCAEGTCYWRLEL